jgi:hypothetical protein
MCFLVFEPKVVTPCILGRREYKLANFEPIVCGEVKKRQIVSRGKLNQMT